MLHFSRRSWVNAIESVKRKLEDNDTVEADEANDPSNPFSKRGEKKNKKGKSKVVSIFFFAFLKDQIGFFIYLSNVYFFRHSKISSS